MSWNVSLFIDGAASLEALANDVSDLLGIKLHRVEHDGSTKYQYSSPNFVVDLYADHEMQNDRDMKFQDYAYELSVWRSATPNREQAQAETLRFAHLAFEKLKKMQRYSLMLVENSQTKLVSFEPDH